MQPKLDSFLSTYLSRFSVCFHFALQLELVILVTQTEQNSVNRADV